MRRLFTALSLPLDAAVALARCAPGVSGGRVVAPQQMHVTLHYLGEADIDRTADALRTVAVEPFELYIEGSGRFESPGAVTVWAGVRPTPELLALHAAVGETLEVVGYVPESRPYTPHVTLARILAFDVRADLVTPPSFVVSIASFCLYTSRFEEDVPVYEPIYSFPLTKIARM